VASHWKALVLSGGVAVVTDDGQDVLPPLLLPFWVILGQHRGAVDKVAVVEVVIVVHSVAKVHACLVERGALAWLGGIVAAVRRALAVAVVVDAAARDEAAPRGVVNKRRLCLGGQPDLHAARQPLHHLREIHLLRLAELVRDCDDPRQAREQLAGEVRVAHAEAEVFREVEVAVGHSAVPLGSLRPLQGRQQHIAEAVRDGARRLEADIGEKVVAKLPRVPTDCHSPAAHVLEGRGRSCHCDFMDVRRQKRQMHWPRQLQELRGRAASQRLGVPRPRDSALVALDRHVDARTDRVALGVLAE